MSLVLDFTQPAASVLLAQLNYDNNTRVTPDQIRVAQVAALPSGPFNTVAIIAAMPGAVAFEGQGYFKYNRIDISTVPGSRSTLFTLSDEQYLSDLLPKINAAWSLNLTAADIDDGLLPSVSGSSSVSFMLTMVASSILWLNEVEISIEV